MGSAVDGSEAAESMDKDDLVHDMDAVSPRSHEDNLPVSQQRVLKFELQLYKLKDSQYLLDVQVSFTLRAVPLCKPSACCLRRLTVRSPKGVSLPLCLATINAAHPVTSAFH